MYKTFPKLGLIVAYGDKLIELTYADSWIPPPGKRNSQNYMALEIPQ